MGLEAPQAPLGHEHSDITRDFYVGKAPMPPDLTVRLERFRPATRRGRPRTGR